MTKKLYKAKDQSTLIYSISEFLQFQTIYSINNAITLYNYAFLYIKTICLFHFLTLSCSLLKSHALSHTRLHSPAIPCTLMNSHELSSNHLHSFTSCEIQKNSRYARLWWTNQMLTYCLNFIRYFNLFLIV